MPYEVRFSSAAECHISKLPRTIHPLIVARAEALADDPRPHGVEKMSGVENAYRVRVGDYRIIYEIPRCSLDRCRRPPRRPLPRGLSVAAGTDGPPVSATRLAPRRVSHHPG